MTLELPRDAVLLPIDIQKAFDDPAVGRRNNPQFEGNVADLFAAWRAAGRPLVHVRHVNPRSSMGFDKAPGTDFKEEARPKVGEAVVTKSVHAAFIGTDLDRHLAAWKAKTLVLLGIQTNYCVATTARMAANLGYTVYVVGDACSTVPQRMLDGSTARPELVHDVALSELHGEFGTVVRTADVLQMLKAKA
jgi:nicotinamidase-related amidase